MASRIPAIRFASVWRAAKPTTRPRTAEEASTPAAVRLTAGNCISASATPITMIPTKTTRRSRRRRVSVTAETSPRETKPANFDARRTSARSMTAAMTSAISTVSSAEIVSRWSVQKSAASGMTLETRAVKAVLLDGMGTLLRLEPPAPRLAAALGVDLATAERAFRAEVAYYLEHQLDGSDTRGLADLRRRSADVLADAAGVPRAGALEALLESLQFEAFADVAPALRDMRTRGLRLVVVSNWDCGLSQVLDRLGLLELIDAVVTSAEVAAAKPHARIFEAALAAAGCAPEEALHVGDSPEADVAGATAAGIRALLIDRARGDTLGSLLS